jgi:hypothetical protein
VRVEDMRTTIETARLNLHHAMAARLTARSRLADAEDRFAAAFDCAASFIAPAAAQGDLGWWRAQAEQAERAVADCEHALRAAVAAAR